MQLSVVCESSGIKVELLLEIKGKKKVIVREEREELFLVSIITIYKLVST